VQRVAQFYCQITDLGKIGKGKKGLKEAKKANDGNDMQQSIVL